MHGGADTVDDLRSVYRLALMSRGIRVAWRALFPKSGLTVGLAFVLHSLLSPVLVLIPVLAHRTRLTIIAAVAFAAVWLTAGPGNGERIPPLLGQYWWWLIVPVLVFSVAAAAGLRRWRGIVKASDASPERRRKQEYGQYRSRAALKAMGGVLAGTALFVPFILAWWQARNIAWIACLLALIVLVPLTHSWASTLPSTAHQTGFWRETTVILATLTLLLGVPLAITVWEITLPFPQWVVFPSALALATVLLLSGWQKKCKWILTTIVATVPLYVALGLVPLCVALARWPFLPPFLTQFLTQILTQTVFRGWSVVAAVILWGVVVWWLPDRSMAWVIEPDDGVTTRR